MSLARFKEQVRDIGLVLAGQTAELAPADGKLYALRDVTGTVPSIPLIAASIMSKKLAGGADAIVLDVKLGNGAFMPTVEKARELAEIMVAIGADAGRETVALLSDMNQPLGRAVGNALEVKEAIATLRGDGPPDFVAHCLGVAGHMLKLAGKASTVAEARKLAATTLEDGRALEKFRAMVEAQGGDVAQVDDPERLPQASHVGTADAPRGGFVQEIDTMSIGWTGVELGGGRQRKGDKIDHAVGLIMAVKVGDRVEAGAPLVEIHANSAEKLAAARQQLAAAITIGEAPVEPLPHIHDVVTAEAHIADEGESS
jgi:pyrimidine-nucleoside phosphorylase